MARKPKDKPNVETRSNRKPTRLGRGLSTLMARPIQVETNDDAQLVNKTDPLSNLVKNSASSKGDSADTHQTPSNPNGLNDEGFVYLSVDAITTNPHQPRQTFHEDSLNRLANSIRNDGLMQPVIVRPSNIPVTNPSIGANRQSKNQRYELVAGERRWRAAQIAGLKKLPVIIRTLDDRQIAEWALIENLQREDLNPIERAQAFQNLIDQFKLSHDQIAERVGIERPTVSNSLRLLSLCDFCRQLVRDGHISAGHAKVLAGVTDPQQQQMIAERAVAQNWTVRQIEKELRQITNDVGLLENSDKTKSAKTGAHLRDLEQQLGHALHTKVKLRSGRKKGAGTLSIEFYDLDHFDSLMQRLNVDIQMD